MHNVRVCRLRLCLLFRLQCALSMLDTNMGVSFVAFGEELKYADAVLLCNIYTTNNSTMGITKFNVPFGCSPLGFKLQINLIDTGQYQRAHVL